MQARVRFWLKRGERIFLPGRGGAAEAGAIAASRFIEGLHHLFFVGLFLEMAPYTFRGYYFSSGMLIE